MMYPEDEIEIFIEHYVRIPAYMMERERGRVREIIMVRLAQITDEALTNAVARWNRQQEARRGRDRFFQVTRLDPEGRE